MIKRKFLFLLLILTLSKHSKTNDLPECPSDFMDGQNVCYQFLDKSTFPPRCPYPDVAPFQTYQDLITNKGPFWMPITRDSDLGLLQWIEPSTAYKTNYQSPYYTDGRFLGRNCLIFYNNSHVQAVPCDQEHFGVCAYLKLNQANGPLCDEEDVLCRISDYGPEASCFCLGTLSTSQKYQLAEFHKLYQNNIYYNLMTNDECAIGLLKRPDDVVIWAHSGTEVEDAYWSPDVINDSQHIFGAFRSNGWILTEEILENQCIIYQKTPGKNTSELQLEFDGTIFKVTATFPKSLKWRDTNNLLLHCFTDAGTENLIYRYVSLTKIFSDWNQTVLSFSPYKQGPGHYWCEAFKYPTVELIKSPVVLLDGAHLYGHEFVMILDMEYIVGTDPLSNKLIEFVERLLFLKLTTKYIELTNYTARIMRILDLDEDSHRVRLNVHLSAKTSDSSTSVEEESAFLCNLVQETIPDLSDFNVQLVEFRDARYCLKKFSTIFGENITWPTTLINTIYSVYVAEEICERKCIGDFVIGAFWDEVSEVDCETPPTVKDSLQKILNMTDQSEMLQDLVQVSLRYRQFTEDNLELFSEVLESVKVDTYKALVDFIGSIDNIMLTEKSVLNNAQVYYNATNKIFGHVKKITNEFLSSNYIEVPLPSYNNLYVERIVKNKYATILLINDTETGKIILDVPTYKETIQYFNSTTIHPQYLICALTFKSNSSFQANLIIFFIDSFFYDIATHRNTDGPIFDITISETHPGETQMSLFYDRTDPEYFDHSCSQWLSEGVGSWIRNVPINGKVPDSMICEFSGSITVSIVQGLAAPSVSTTETTSVTTTATSSTTATPTTTTTIATTTTSSPENITDDLNNIIISNMTTSEIIHVLLVITEKYEKFTVQDVSLTGKVFAIMSNRSDVCLKSLTKIISNLHEINRDVLSESQTKFSATDEILYHIDNIVLSHNYRKPIQICSSNFMMLISDIQETNLTGLILSEDNRTLKSKILTSDEDISKIPGDFDSVLMLSSELRQQLSDESTIRVMYYTSNALFNDHNTEERFVSKIFGVILPKLKAPFAGPLYTYHKLNKMPLNSCSFWNFNPDNNISGTWKKDNNGVNEAPFIECQFWHTTHFALLLMSEDPAWNQFHILDIITSVNICLSLFGLGAIITTAILFKRWRINTGNQILLNFVASLLLQIGGLYLSSRIYEHHDDLFCIIVGVLLHYSVIAQFSWMVVIAILQFKRFVQVLTGPPKYVLLKAIVCGWGSPLLPVLCTFFLDKTSYRTGKAGLCYPSGISLYLGVWLPISIIIFINSAIFLYIIYSVVHKKTEYTVKGSNDFLFQWRLGVLLFFMLGLAWIFAFLSMVEFGQIFGYLFAMTASLQGFVMFLFFIAFNQNTRALYISTIHSYFVSTKY